MIKRYANSFILVAILLVSSLTSNAQTQANKVMDALSKNRIGYDLTQSDINDWIVSDNYTTKHNGVSHLYLQQTIGGIPVELAVMNVVVKEDGTIFSVKNRFVKDAHSKKSGTVSISAEQALRLSIIAVEAPMPSEITVKERNSGTAQLTTYSIPELSTQEFRAELVYIQGEDEQLQLVWRTRVHIDQPFQAWETYVDAGSGRIVKKADRVLRCDFGNAVVDPSCKEAHAEHAHICHAGHNHSSNEDVNTTFAAIPNSYRVYPLTIESPNHGGRALEVDPTDLVASPFGWHDTNGAAGAEYTITRGNNVLAQEDQNGNNGSGFSPDGGPNLEFDFSLDFGQDIETDGAFQNRSSVITNLFYWNNIMHDVWYRYGFDEASGNFQQNNYGNGGLGNDYVFADAQDGSGTNNANFSTFQDGQNGRMQMFLWNGSITGSFTVNSPGTIAGNYPSTNGAFGSANYSVTADIVLVDDGTGATSTLGCGTSYVNNVAGKIALIDRGDCQFGSKCLLAQDEGAVAAIVINNEPGGTFGMGPGFDGGSVTIPSIMISQADGNAIKAQLASGAVNATLIGNSVQALDGSLDNGIIAHEYGHGISIRLTGGPGNPSCLGNQEQMGEGWSDFFGLALTVQPGDDKNKVRGIGTYAAGQSTTSQGIRSYPYTHDMSINPFTYDDIKSESVPHGVGSVMCTMLWDLYWDLVEVHGFDTDLYNGTGGNNIAMQLVIDGLKLQPCSPGFIDYRDAILEADELNYGGANKCIIWNAFARRGLGYSASQGSSNSRGDGVEAFDLPPDGQDLSITKTADRSEALEGEVVTYTVTIANQCSDVSNVKVSDILPGAMTYVPGSASDGGTENAGEIVWPDIANLPRGSSRSYTYQATIDAGTYSPPGLILADDMESGDGNWTTSNTTGLSDWVLVSAGGDTEWFAEELEGGSTVENQRLDLYPICLGEGGELTFTHRYSTEVNWDGGQVFISTNGGGSFTDLGPFMTENGYNDYITDNPSNEAFAGNSGGYITTKVDLSSFSGNSVIIRFNFYYDNAVDGQGWRIDDVFLSGGSAANNIATVISDQGTASTSNCVAITQSTSNEEVLAELPQIRLFPNPVDGNGLNVELMNMAGEKDVRVEIFDQAGRLVQQINAAPGAYKSIVSVPTNQLANGLYTIRVVGKEFSLAEKVIVNQ